MLTEAHCHHEALDGNLYTCWMALTRKVPIPGNSPARAALRLNMQELTGAHVQVRSGERSGALRWARALSRQSSARNRTSSTGQVVSLAPAVSTAHLACMEHGINLAFIGPACSLAAARLPLLGE